MKQASPHIQSLFGVLEQKWVLRILWQLNQQPASFQDLQSLCGNPSPTIISKRLRLLQDEGFIEKQARSYQLSQLGLEASQLLSQFDALAKQWHQQDKS